MSNSIVFIALALLPLALCQTEVGLCNIRWTTQVRCTRVGLTTRALLDYQFPVPNAIEQNRIKRAIENCFKQQGCYTSPVPTVQETNARRDCFKASKRQLDKELNECVDSRIKGWNPVDDYPRIDIDEWRYTVQQTFDGLRNPKDYCGPNDARRTRALKECVERDTSVNFNVRPARTLPEDWCEAEAKCWADTSYNCQNLWDVTVQPALCACSKRLGPEQETARAAANYKQCMDRRVRTVITEDDPGVVWLTEYVKSLCFTKLSHPCRRQRQKYVTG